MVNAANTSIAVTTTMTYDALGRKISMNDPDMGSWSYAYDANGNLTTQVAPGQTLWFGYDALNRLTLRRLNNSSGTLLNQFAYDAPSGTWSGIGRQTSAWTLGSYGDGNSWQGYYYDGRGRPNYVRDIIDGVGTFLTSYTYDSADRQITMGYPYSATDSVGDVLTTLYNAASQPIKLANQTPREFVKGASYNVLGQPNEIQLGNGLSNRTYYFGSNLNAAQFGPTQLYGRVRQVCVLATSAGECADDGRAGTTPSLLNLVYAYDAIGNLSAMNDRTRGTALSYTYDPLDRLTGTSGEYAESYAFNEIGNLTSKTGVGTYQYTHTAHKHAVTSLNNGPQMAWYDAQGNMTQRIENGVTYAQGWDADNRLASVTNVQSGQSTRYSYGAGGQRVRKVETGTVQFADAFNNLDTSSWAFNTLPSVIVNDAGQNVLKTNSDNNWRSMNRSSNTLTTGKSATIDFKLDNADTGAHFVVEDGINSRFGVVASGGNIYVHYVDSGCAWCAGPNVVTGTLTNVWYRLTITLDDVSGFKVEIRQRDTGAGYASYTRAMSASLGRSWKFVHFMYTAGTSAYLDNYTERQTGSQTTAYLGNYYEYGVQGSTSYYYLGGQRIAMRQGVPVTYLHGDMLGSASLATNDTTAAKVSDLRYKPFGEVSYQWGAMPTDKRFTGQRAELGSGLYDYGARFYSPWLGRFVSPDSVYDGGLTQPQGLNRYSYTRGNPLRYTDPTGHQTSSCGYGDGCEPRSGPLAAQGAALEYNLTSGQSPLNVASEEAVSIEPVSAAAEASTTNAQPPNILNRGANGSITNPKNYELRANEIDGGISTFDAEQVTLPETAQALKSAGANKDRVAPLPSKMVQDPALGDLGLEWVKTPGTTEVPIADANHWELQSSVMQGLPPDERQSWWDTNVAPRIADYVKQNNIQHVKLPRME